MLKSMTGFGRFESETPERKISVEMKAVNHRYCEISLKMPKKLNFFESAIRNLLKNYISRGKVCLLKRWTGSLPKEKNWLSTTRI